MPVELDRIFASLDELSVALGPEGANSDGALSRVLATGADNLDGNGEALGATIEDLGAALDTVATPDDDLFETVRNLQTFTTTLAENDQAVTDLNTNLATVSDQLAGERDDLALALQNLAVALTEVSTFVQENRDVLTEDVAQLESVTASVASQQEALAETLVAAPTALSNLGNAYNPRSGTLDTRDNFGPIEADPLAFICSLVNGSLASNPDGENPGGCEGVLTELSMLLDLLPVGAGGSFVGLARAGRHVRSDGDGRHGPGAGPHPRRHPPGGWSVMVRSLARRLAALLALAVLLTGCQGAYDLPLPGGAANGSDVYRVTIEFEDVLDLVPQSAVKVDDVTVGAVESIELEDWHAKVVVRLEDSVELPDNADARLRQTSLLGEKFVSLSAPGSGAEGVGRLSDGDLIPLDRTGRNPEVEEVLGALSLLLNGGGVAQLQTINRELNDALEGRESDVKEALEQLDVFVSGLDEQKSEIVRAIDAIDRLAATLEAQEQDIATALDTIPGGLEVLADQREDLTAMLTALSDLGVTATRVIDASQADTVANLQALDPILTQLAAAGDALPNSLDIFVSYPFPDNAVDGIKGDYTNLRITLDANLSDLDSLAPQPTGGPSLPTLPTLPSLADAADPDDPAAARAVRRAGPAGGLRAAAGRRDLRRARRRRGLRPGGGDLRGLRRRAAARRAVPAPAAARRVQQRAGARPVAVPRRRTDRHPDRADLAPADHLRDRARHPGLPGRRRQHRRDERLRRHGVTTPSSPPSCWEGC